MLCISNMAFYGIYKDGTYISAQEQEIKHLKEENEKLLQENQEIKILRRHNIKLLDQCEKLRKRIKEKGYIEENEKLLQEKQELKKELETLKQFELDRILDASMCEIFTSERQFLRESTIL